MKRKSPDRKQYIVNPKLEELLWFVYTVKCGNAARASKKLKIRNTALIPAGNRRLEKQLGIKLLNQNAGPTEAGIEFAKYAARVLAAHRRAMRAMKKFEKTHNALPRITLHVETWMLDKLDFQQIIPIYEIDKIIRYDEPMKLWHRATISKKKDAFVVCNSSMYDELSPRFSEKHTIVNYLTKFFGNKKADQTLIRQIEMNCFGPTPIGNLLPDGVEVVKVATVENPVELRNAILGGSGVGVLPVFHWSDGLTEIFPEENFSSVSIWLLTNVK